MSCCVPEWPLSWRWSSVQDSLLRWGEPSWSELRWFLRFLLSSPFLPFQSCLSKVRVDCLSLWDLSFDSSLLFFFFFFLCRQELLSWFLSDTSLSELLQNVRDISCRNLKILLGLESIYNKDSVADHRQQKLINMFTYRCLSLFFFFIFLLLALHSSDVLSSPDKLHFVVPCRGNELLERGDEGFALLLLCSPL